MFSLKLAVSNLRKRKGALPSFLILSAVAAMLLVAGLVLLFYVPEYYDESNDRLKEPHYIVRMNDNTYSPDYLKTMEQDSRAEQVAAMECIVMDNARFLKEDKEMLVFASFLNADEDREFFSFHPLYSDPSIDKSKAIFLPLSFKQQGYEIGDQVQFELKKKFYDFQIAGFFETTWFGSSATVIYTFYLYEEAYQPLRETVGGGKYLAATLYDKEEAETFAKDYKENSGIDFGSPNRDMNVVESTIGNMKTVTTMVISIISVLMVSVSGIILLICFLVIRFGISNYIEDQLRQIGVLEALGCTKFQIRLSIVMEQMLGAGIGSIFGVGLSYGLTSVLGLLISGTLGVEWRNPFHPGIDAVGFLIVICAVAVISYLSSGRIRTLTPVAALRKGTLSHHFKKDYFPLEEGGGKEIALSFQLAVKTVLQAPFQYLTFAVILIGITFVMAFSVILYQGLGMDSSGFIRLSGLEISDATAYLAPHKDQVLIREKLQEMKQVKSTALFENASFTVNGIDMGGFVSDNFSNLQTFKTYEGSAPVYENEITLTGVVAKRLGKGIGDTVTVEMNGASAEFMITGLNQTLNNFGLQCTMTLEGVRRINPSFSINSVYVYFEEGVSYEEFVAAAEDNFYFMNSTKDQAEMTPEEQLKLETQEKIADLMTMYGVDSAQYALMDHGELILSGDTEIFELDTLENTKALSLTNISLYVNMIRILTVFLAILTAAVIAIILHFMVKSSIAGRKQELGIFKALGYTSSQLMLQISFCYLPISIPGIGLGCLFAAAFTNPLMSGLTTAVGISSIGFTVSPLILLATAGMISLFIFLAAYGAARAVKHVSVYELFTE